MQFLIDTDTESREGLLAAAQVMLLLANAESLDVSQLMAAAAAPKPIKAPTPPPVGKPVAPAPAAPLPPGNVPPPPVVHPPVHPDALPKVDDVPAGTDPAALFGHNRPLVPPAPVVTVPDVPAVNVAAAPPAASAPPASITGQLPNGTAPGTANAVSTSTAVDGGRDSEGLPWDARIHSETKKTNADGTWRYRRNLDAGVKAAVHAELKATYGQQVLPQQPPVTVASAVPVPPPPAAVPVPPAATVAVPVPPPPAAGIVPPPPGTEVAPPTATVLPFPAAPTAAVPVPPATSLGVPNANNGAVVQVASTFRELMQKVNVALASGRLTQPQLSEACKAAGVDSVTALAAQPMLVPTVDANLNRWLAA